MTFLTIMEEVVLIRILFTVTCSMSDLYYMMYLDNITAGLLCMLHLTVVNVYGCDYFNSLESKCAVLSIAMHHIL